MATAVINPETQPQEVVLSETLSRKSWVTEEKVMQMCENIIEKCSPRKIIAFGSRARGTHKPHSDLDIVILVDEYDHNTDHLPVHHSDLKVWMSVDMLVASVARHEYMKGSIISVHDDIEREGVVLYDASVGSIDCRAVARVAR